MVHRLSISLSRVAILETGNELTDRGLSKANLLSSEFDASQLVGGAIHWLGIPALVIPSARSDSSNLIIFPENLGPEDSIEIVSTYDYQDQ